MLAEDSSGRQKIGSVLRGKEIGERLCGIGITPLGNDRTGLIESRRAKLKLKLKLKLWLREREEERGAGGRGLYVVVWSSAAPVAAAPDQRGRGKGEGRSGESRVETTSQVTLRAIVNAVVRRLDRLMALSGGVEVELRPSTPSSKQQ